MKVMVTGPRPQKLPQKHHLWVKAQLWDVVRRVLEKYPKAVFISGMALGVDTWWAQAVVCEGGSLHCFIPFDGQEKRWSQKDQELFHQLREASARETICNTGPYKPRHFIVRDHAMCDYSTICVSVIWEGYAGGTKGTVDYWDRTKLDGTHYTRFNIDPTTRTTQWLK